MGARSKDLILTVAEAALVVGLDEQTVRGYLRAHTLPAVSGPGPLRVYLRDAVALRAERAAHPTKRGRPPSCARLAALLQEVTS